MKKQNFHFISILFTITLMLSACGGQTNKPIDSLVEGWAVLAEKDDYKDVGMADLIVDYIDIIRVREALVKQGWDPDQIHDLKEFTRKDLEEELDWLEENADDNDIVFFYVTSHGNYLSEVVSWRKFFGEQWAQIPSQQRLLLVDSCTAAHFTNAVKSDPGSHLSIAAVDGDEYGWKGLEEEGLPIVGGVFTYYFVEALENPASDADTDGDGLVSVQEAVLWAEDQQQIYMHEVVFAVPEFIESYHAIGVSPELDPASPDVIMDDSIGEALFLGLDADQ